MAIRKRKSGLKIIVVAFLAPLLFSAETGMSGEYEFRGLLPGEGRELVLENCTGCHSTAIILQNRMSRRDWDETLTWMREKQGLQELSSHVRDKILNYLEKTQGPQKIPTGQGRSKRMYQFEYRPNPL